MPKALIVYGTKNGQIKKIADLVAGGMELSGVEPTVLAEIIHAKRLRRRLNHANSG